jgi:tRNA(Ile)-lysidine synthase TilS/MesJ
MFSNLSKGIHFDNLSGMVPMSVESDITILRPFLSIPKSQIINLADSLDIPHLQDSTPPWSRRGQTRDTLMPAINQFDPNILTGLDKFVKYAQFLHQQWEANIYEWIISLKMQKMQGPGPTQSKTILTIPMDQTFMANYKNVAFWVKIWFECDLPTRPSNKSFQNLINCIETGKSLNCDLNKYFKTKVIDNVIKICYK